ncbi:hypothetical protein [Phascolarctobacterium sp.]
MSGWIKLHRKLLKSRAWCGADAEGKVILITLLLNACHSVTHWQITTDKNAVLNPGELFISYRRFAKSCGVSLKKLTSEFNRLAVVGFLECKSKREGTIVHIKNWECYQLADTPLDTLLGTDLETLANADTARASTENIAAAETPKGTALGTPLATHNKNYILLKNKLNNTDTNKKLRSAAAEPEFAAALQEYDAAFTSAKHRLTDDERRMLQAFAVTAKAVWVLQAVRELKAANKGKVIRNPKNYLFGILGNWLTDGLPNDNKATQQSLDEFYRQEGIT